MNKKEKREAGRIKQEEALAQNVASGLEAQKADHIRQEDRERRMAAEARKKNAEYDARLAGRLFDILDRIEEE